MKCWRCWVLGLMVVIATAVISSWAVFHIYESDGVRFPEFVANGVMGIASYPQKLRLSFESAYSIIKNEPSILLRDENFEGEIFPCMQDSGYLLLSGVDPDEREFNVRLIKVSNGEVIHTWPIDFQKIPRANSFEGLEESDPFRSIAFNPYLLSDGSVIIQMDGRILKINSEGKIIWVTFGNFHHSVDVDVDGRILASGLSYDYLKFNDGLKRKIKDNTIVNLSADGKILSNESFSKILIDNGFEELLFGHNVGPLQVDPIHINSINVAKTDARHWKRGDLLISARALSTIFLYRPSTHKIIWHQSGPWFNQHDAEFFDGSHITVYGNNIISGLKPENAFIGQTNHFYIVDFEANTTKKEFDEQFKRFAIKTISEGRSRLLKNGNLFVEETNRNRHFIIDKNGAYCLRYNKFDNERTGAVSWSRYIELGELPRIFR